MRGRTRARLLRVRKIAAMGKMTSVLVDLNSEALWRSRLVSFDHGRRRAGRQLQKMLHWLGTSSLGNPTSAKLLEHSYCILKNVVTDIRRSSPVTFRVFPTCYENVEASAD